MAQIDLPKNIAPIEGEQVKSTLTLTSTSKLPAWAAKIKVADPRAQPWKELARETVTFGDGADQVDVLKDREVTSGAMLKFV